MTMYDMLKQAGILDPKWQLPLGAGGGRDNIIKDTAVALALTNGPDRFPWTGPVCEFLTCARVAPGLYMREQGNTSPNSVDNLIGASVACYLLELAGYEAGILARGLAHNWTYSASNPAGTFRLWNPWSWKCARDWYGRFIGFPSFVCRASGLLWALSVWWTCRTPASNSSDKVLLWLMWQAQPIRGKAYRYWQRRMTAQYGTAGGLMATYYGGGHPFALAAKDLKF